MTRCWLASERQSIDFGRRIWRYGSIMASPSVSSVLTTISLDRAT